MSVSGVSTPVAALRHDRGVAALRHDRGVAALRPGRGAVRHVRAMAASLACVTTAFAAHIASGGSAAPTTVIGAFVVSGALAWLLAGVRLTTPQLLGLLLLCQTGVHVVSMASSTHDASMGPTMLMMHAAGTVVSLVALACGETFVWAVADRLALRPMRLLRTGFTTPATAPTIVSIPATRPRAAHAVRVTPVRGPPTGLVPVVASL